MFEFSFTTTTPIPPPPPPPPPTATSMHCSIDRARYNYQTLLASRTGTVRGTAYYTYSTVQLLMHVYGTYYLDACAFTATWGMMASSGLNRCCAFSHFNGHFAVTSADGRLSVWDSNTGVKRQHYTPSSHLSSTCTCLAWQRKTRRNKVSSRSMDD